MDEQWESLKEELVSLGSSSKPSEIEVPPKVYYKCKELYKAERSCRTPCRYPYLKRSTVYPLLIDFLRKNLTEEELTRPVNISEKFHRLKQALNALVKYGLNLLGSPNNKLFHRVKLTSPYFVYNVKKHCVGGELFLHAMGYRQKQGTSEMLYSESGGLVFVDTMIVAGTVVDLLVIVEMLDTILKLKESLKHDKCMHDFKTVFREEFQESFPTAGSATNVPGTSEQHKAPRGWAEQPYRPASSQQGGSQQWLGISSKPAGAPSSYPLHSAGDRGGISTDLLLADLPRLYPSAPPTAKTVPQAQPKRVPAAQVDVKQPTNQPVSDAQYQDMYGEDDAEPQLEQRGQPLPRSPQPQRSAPRMRQDDHITHVPGYAMNNLASEFQACHLSDSPARDRMHPGGAAHAHGRGQVSSSSEPPRPPVQQGSGREQFSDFTKIEYPSESCGRPAQTGSADIVHIDYRGNTGGETSSPHHGNSEYLNADVISKPVLPPRRHSHEVSGNKMPVPTPRRGPGALSTLSEPKAAFHSWSPPTRPAQHVHSTPHATDAYQSLGFIQQGPAQYAQLQPQASGAHQPPIPAQRRPSAHTTEIDTNTYEPLAARQHGPYAHLAPMGDRNPPMQYRSPPHSLGSTGSAQHVARMQYDNRSEQHRQLPEPPHSSDAHGYINIHVSSRAASKPAMPQQLAADRHHSEDSSGGSAGQYNSGEYSKNGPSSDEEHTFLPGTRV